MQSMCSSSKLQLFQGIYGSMHLSVSTIWMVRGRELDFPAIVCLTEQKHESDFAHDLRMVDLRAHKNRWRLKDVPSFFPQHSLHVSLKILLCYCFALSADHMQHICSDCVSSWLTQIPCQAIGFREKSALENLQLSIWQIENDQAFLTHSSCNEENKNKIPGKRWSQLQIFLKLDWKGRNFSWVMLYSQKQIQDFQQSGNSPFSLG